VFSKMTFGALCGLEFTEIFAGESRNPVRQVPRAILPAVPLRGISLYFWGQRSFSICVSRFRGFDRTNPTGAASGIRGHERGANHSAGSDASTAYKLSGEL
jgi:hypothetical protein